MPDKEIYLLRHGDTGLKNQYIGSSDVSLSPRGIEEVKKSCGFLSSVDFDAVMCSPMKRCTETAAHLTGSPPVQILDFLREIDFGRWEKKTFQEIIQNDQDEVDRWVQKPETFRFPEGESLIDFKKRITTTTDFLYQTDGERILVVCHGGIIRHLLCSLLRIPGEQYLLFEIQSGCYSTVRLHPQGGVLTGLNLKG
ncbi:histidine phosphatase family protein [Desulforhopalus sp. 52FAK]